MFFMAKTAVKAQWRGLVKAIAIACVMGGIGMWSLGWLDKDVSRIGSDVLSGVRHYLGVDEMAEALPPPRPSVLPPSVLHVPESSSPSQAALSPTDTLTYEHASRGAVIGYPRIIEADLIELNGTKLRLWGVDAPESEQWCTKNGRQWRCGVEAQKALREHVAGNLIACYDKGLGEDDELVLGQCFLGHLDLNGWLARNGWAMAYRRATSMYSSRESMAKFQRLNIWHDGGIEAPWEWRRSNGLRISQR